MSNFIDECRIFVKSGDGGGGCISFRREAHNPRGGPDGGDGGKGGDVWLIANLNISSLITLKNRPHQKAERGQHGKGKSRHGSAGQDCRILVPVGTQVFSDAGEKLADLKNPNDSFLASKGGAGGKGNARFLSNRRRAPAFAEQGEPLEEKTLRLELKLLADIAIIGFPNAGKSTLISKISAAKPKIGDYPFTTLEPNLGVVVTKDGRDFVVADIPGLIEGASQGKGLGHQFLRHAERARVLAVLVDLSSEIKPEDQLEVLLKELKTYRSEMFQRKRVIAGSKLDVSEYQNSSLPEFLDVAISSATGKNIDSLVYMLADTLKKAADPQDIESLQEPVVHRPLEESVGVEKLDKGVWRLIGRPVLRAVALSDLTQPEVMLLAQERLSNLGTDQILSHAGAQEGDTVWVGELSFEFTLENK